MHASWGLTITWNDHHSTGIFAWGLLRSWADTDAAGAEGSARPATRARAVARSAVAVALCSGMNAASAVAVLEPSPAAQLEQGERRRDRGVERFDRRRHRDGEANRLLSGLSNAGGV